MSDSILKDPEDKENFSVWLKHVLKTNIATVTFKKKDGSIRIMQCTLDPKIVPAYVVTENKKTKKTNNNVMAVYDTEVEGWRSFTLDSVQSVEFTLN